MTYQKVSVNKKKYTKKFTVNKTTGDITVKRGVKKGKYKLRVNVTAVGNYRYEPETKTVTVTIRVQ